MLHIDRVNTEMEVLQRSTAGPAESPEGPGLVPGQPAFDPQMKERMRDVVMDVLKDHLRELERRGTL